MKRINWLAISVLVLVISFWTVVIATTFSDTYDITTPAGSDDPAEADDRMREIKAAVQERMNVTMYWPLTGNEVSDADAGENRKILFHVPIASTPTVAADHGDLRIKDVANGSDTLAEFIFTNESEEELQLSSSGNNLANNVNLTATNAAGTGSVNLIKATTGDIPEILVGAVLSADTAPAVDAGIANKKYVDDQIDFSALATDDADSATLVIDVTYTAVTDGFVTVQLLYGNNSDIDIIATVAAVVVQKTTLVNNGDFGNMSFSVAAAETFVITDSAGTPTTTVITWRSRGALSKPTK